jgi:glutaredoxin 3
MEPDMPVVKMYSTPSCIWCRRVEEYFKNKGVQFEHLDVSSDRAALKDMIEKSGQMGVPVITVDNEVIVGFDQARLEQLLTSKK